MRKRAKRKSRVSDQEANEVKDSSSSRGNQKRNPKSKRAETLLIATDQKKTEVVQAGAGSRKKYVRRLKLLKEVDSSLAKGSLVECTSGSVTCLIPREGDWLVLGLGWEHDTVVYCRNVKELFAELVSLCTQEMNLHKEIGDGLLQIKQPKSLLQITQSPSFDTNAAVGVLEELCEHDRTTEVESSANSGLEQAGSQTVSIETTDSQRKITKVDGESGGTLRENEEQSQLICHEDDSVGLAGDNEPEAGQDLPFVKSLEIWKAVESMEIFKVMPQKPHFHPLVESKEILREGLAIGYMLNFSSLVQKTSKLTVADPKNLFTTILDALPEFEILGFDVKAVRDRTSLLLSMKDRHEHLQYHSKEVILQANQCSDELSKLNEDIDANQRMLRELENKQADLLSRKKGKISEITSLKVCAGDTAKDIKNLEADFESIAGSLW